VAGSTPRQSERLTFVYCAVTSPALMPTADEQRREQHTLRCSEPTASLSPQTHC
jgi:hypothetical protein